MYAYAQIERIAADLKGDRPEWHERALCSQTDPEAFFPEKGGTPTAAKRICGRCEVKTECLIYALENDERHGVWGGTTGRERRKLKQRPPRRRPQPGLHRRSKKPQAAAT